MGLYQCWKIGGGIQGQEGMLHMMMRDLVDKLIHRLQPVIKTGTKSLAVEVTQEAKSNLQIKEIMGETQTNRDGLGSTSNQSAGSGHGLSTQCETANSL